MFDLQFAVVRERLRKAKAQMLKNRVVQTAQSPTAVGFDLNQTSFRLSKNNFQRGITRLALRGGAQLYVLFQ